MNNELQNKLLKNYPEFFEYLKDIPDNSPVLPIYFGFEVGDGWYTLLDNLMRSIQSYTKYNQKRIRIKNKFIRNLHNITIKISSKFKYRYYKQINKIARYIYEKAQKENYEKFSQVSITQIKEKYGTLRFYYYGGDEHIAGMVSFAEDMSAKICETCGSTKNVTQTKGWIKTICQECLDKENLERELKKDKPKKSKKK